MRPQLTFSSSPRRDKSKGKKNKGKQLPPPKGPTRRNEDTASRRRSYLIAIGVVIVVAAAVGVYTLSQHGGPPTTGLSSATTTTTNKPIILYVDQGNGRVDETNFNVMTTFAKAKGFNTVFFQVYRSGSLLNFTNDSLKFFVGTAHLDGLRIFFSLYFTSPTEQIPTSIYALGEDGINLDMSNLPYSAQVQLLSTLTSNFHNGTTAVTATNFTTTLKPGWLILETYGVSNQQYVHRGIIASVGVFGGLAPTNQDYTNQFQYALANSDGVMVFDYYWLQKSGY